MVYGSVPSATTGQPSSASWRLEEGERSGESASKDRWRGSLRDRTTFMIPMI